MRLYSNQLSANEVHLAFKQARDHGADIYAVDVRDFKPKRGYARGVEFYAESIRGTRPTAHREIGSYSLDDVPRAAAWDAYGYVIAYLFKMDPGARIGGYGNAADFRRSVAQETRRKEPTHFLAVLG